MKHKKNFPEAYIKDAIHNPLLFQEHNPLISQSMSLLNSRMKKSFDSELQHLTSKQLSKGSGRRGKHIQESSQSQHNQETYDLRQQEEDEMDNSRAIKQFEREIQEKFKISVASKLYTFPRLKITSIMDIISSSESEDDEEPTSQPSSQQPSNQYNPFDPIHYQQKMKTEYIADEEISEKSNEDEAERNFKKIKQHNAKAIDGSKKTKERKTESLKKEEYSSQIHRQKGRNGHKNQQGHIKQKPRVKQSGKAEKLVSKDHLSMNQKPQQAWAVKQAGQKHKIERLKTEMCNDSSRQSDSFGDSKRRFYEEEFFIRK